MTALLVMSDGYEMLDALFNISLFFPDVTGHKDIVLRNSSYRNRQNDDQHSPKPQLRIY